MVSQAGLVVVHLGLAGKSFSVPSAAWWNRSTRRTKGAGRVLSGTMSLMGNAQVHGHVDSYAKCSQTSTAQHSISRPKSDFSTALTTLHTVNDLHFMLQQYWHWKTKINQILTLADFTRELLRQMKKLWYIKRQIINLNEHWLLKEQVLLLMTTCYGETRRYRRWMLCAAMTCGRACHRLLFFQFYRILYPLGNSCRGFTVLSRWLGRRYDRTGQATLRDCWILCARQNAHKQAQNSNPRPPTHTRPFKAFDLTVITIQIWSCTSNFNNTRSMLNQLH